MKVQLNRVNDSVHFEAKGSSSEVKVHIDGSPEIGGEGLGVRPMEMILMALASCSSLDLISILKKQRQEITSFKADVEGVREEVGDAKPFKNIYVVFYLEGNIKENKALKAAQLSFEKYCSVAKTVEPTATIHYKVVLNGVELAKT